MSYAKTRPHWFKALSQKSLNNEDLFYIVVWSLVFVMQVTRCYYNYAIGISDKMEWRWVVDDWIGLLPFLILFFLSKWVFEPKFFFRQKIRTFILTSLLSAFVLIFSYSFYTSKHLPSRVIDRAEQLEKIHGFSVEEFRPDRHEGTLAKMFHGQFIPLYTMAVLVMGTSLCISIVFRSRRETLILKVEEAEKVKTELDYLKYQINPHFFMNTLNNIHALVDIDSQMAKDAIIELSRLMRYMLYETSLPTVPFQKEVQFHKHFVELMRLRFDDTVQITYDEGNLSPQTLNAQVPPLLGIVFIENAFKFGISHHEPSYIDIRYSEEPDHYFHFHCSNSNFSKEYIEKRQSGLGLVNIRKRLDLLYSDKYKLDIKSTEKEFTVDLFIPLQFFNTL